MFPHGSSDAPGYQCGPYNLDDDEQGPWRAFRGQTSQTSHLRLGKPLTDEEDEDDDQDDDDDDFGVTSEQNLESQASRIWSHKRDIGFRGPYLKCTTSWGDFYDIMELLYITIWISLISWTAAHFGFY